MGLRAGDGGWGGLMAALSIAAIIPVYNRPKSVIEALESVAAQTRPPTRAIVVDDGSEDDSAERVEAWIARTPLPFPTVLIRQPNQGVSVARNRGAVEAQDCDLLAFLDSDDLWPPDYLARMGDAMAVDPEAVAATSDRTDVDIVSRQVVRHELAYLARQTTQRLLVKGAPWTSNTVLRASVFHAVGGYDPAMRTGQDWQLMLRMSLRGPWLHVRGAPVTYRLGMSTLVLDEADNLSATYSDSRFRRVQMLERFVLEEGGKDAVERPVWVQVLAQRWYKAGRQFMKHQRPLEARKCFMRSLYWKPTFVKSWWGALSTFSQKPVEPIEPTEQDAA